MTKTPGVSLASLDARAASEEAFEFEYIASDGSGTGIMLKVLGSQSATVTRETNRLINERRRQEAVRAAKGSKRNGDDFTPVEDDIAFGQRLSAVRLVGWTGIDEECSPTNALTLCQSNAEVSSQILDASNNLANFIKASSKA